MTSLTIDRFDGGLLLARPSSVSPANSLSAMRNMEVQPGGWLRSRAKLKPTAGALAIGPQWKGLEANAGYLWVFSAWNVASSGKISDIVNADTGERVVYAFYSTGVGGTFSQASRCRLLGVTRWNSGFLAVLSPDGGTTNYAVLFSVNTATHTVTGANVADVNCPKTGKMVTATARIYAISDDGLSVKFCKVGDPSDWTTAGTPAPCRWHSTSVVASAPMASGCTRASWPSSPTSPSSCGPSMPTRRPWSWIGCSTAWARATTAPSCRSTAT